MNCNCVSGHFERRSCGRTRSLVQASVVGAVTAVARFSGLPLPKHIPFEWRMGDNRVQKSNVQRHKGL